MCRDYYLFQVYSTIYLLQLHLKSDIHLNNALIRIELKLKLEIFECSIFKKSLMPLSECISEKSRDDR